MSIRLSLDPSINTTGFAISKNEKIITSGVIRTRGKTDAEKLHSLFVKLQSLNKKYNFSEVILEVTDFYIYQNRKNPITGKPLNIKSLCKLNKAIGIIELFCSLHQIKLTELTPGQWKRNLPKSVICSLTKIKNHNEAEAVLLNMAVN